MGLCFHFLCLKHRHSFWTWASAKFLFIHLKFCHWDTLLPELLAKCNGAGCFCQLNKFFPSRIWLLCQCYCYQPLLSRALLSVFLPWIKLPKIMWMLPISEYQITFLCMPVPLNRYIPCDLRAIPTGYTWLTFCTMNPPSAMAGGSHCTVPVSLAQLFPLEWGLDMPHG